MNQPNNIHRVFNAGHVILALFAGAVAGAGVAYLTAPASGAAMRTRLRTMAHDTNTAAHHVPEAVRKASEAARDAFVTALELGDDSDALTVKPKKQEPKIEQKTEKHGRQDHATA